MSKLGVPLVCIVLCLLLGLLLTACGPQPQPVNDRRAGGIISIHPFPIGPDTLMQFTIGPDTLGATAETLWIAKQDCTLTIKYTNALPIGPDTLMAGHQFRVVTKRLTPSPQMKR